MTCEFFWEEWDWVLPPKCVYDFFWLVWFFCELFCHLVLGSGVWGSGFGVGVHRRCFEMVQSCTRVGSGWIGAFAKLFEYTLASASCSLGSWTDGSIWQFEIRNLADSGIRYLCCWNRIWLVYGKEKCAMTGETVKISHFFTLLIWSCRPTRSLLNLAALSGLSSWLGHKDVARGCFICWHWWLGFYGTLWIVDEHVGTEHQSEQVV